MPDGTVPTSGYLSQQVQAGVTQTGSGGGGSACLTSGGFTSPNLASAVQSAGIESGPLFKIERQVFMHHRHNSAVGPGWAIAELPQLYPEPNADHAVLVGGDGSEEDFRLWPFARSPFPTNGYQSYAFALDPTTGEQMMAGNGNIVRLNADGSTTTVAAGIAYTGVPQSMAITYVGGERRFLLATTSELVQVHAGGTLDVLSTRSGNVPSNVAARNDLAIYTEGLNSNPVLYRIRLSTPPGAPEVISFSQATGGDIGLDPKDRVLGIYRFYGPGGVAYSPAGALYVADSPRNAVFLVQPDANGEIGPTSAIDRVVGDGAGRYVPDAGTPFAGTDLPINQPFLLSVAPDGTLLMGAPYGVAAYDPMSNEAEWIAFGQSAPGSKLSIDLTGAAGNYTNIAATGPRTFLIAFSQSGTWPSIVDASKLASERDPTRTLTLTPTGAMIVDTTQGLVDNFDGQGRLMQRDLQTGEPLFAVTYLDPQSDRVNAITDPEGLATTFAYDSNTRLHKIADPANRTTILDHDASGDLRAVTQPDGEVTAFIYQGHHLTSKTTRGIDVTQYAYNADGTLHSATKPAGETTTITTASLDQPPQYDANGNVVYSGSYTDAHGVTHAFVTDSMGQLQSDAYVADGVTYNYSALYYGRLEPVAGEVYGHANSMLRIRSETLNGVPTGPSQSFDSLGRLVDVAESGGLGGGQSVAYYSYNANGFLSDVSLSPMSQYDQAITRDAAGHVLQILDHGNGGWPNRHEVDFTWRTDGQAATITRDGLVYTLSYDASTHALVGISDALGRTTSLTPDSAGNVLQATVGNPAAAAGDGSTVTSFAYDGNNRLLVAADALGHQTTFGYTQVSCGCTESDEITSIHTPDLAVGQQWSLIYGPEGRLSSITDPDGFPEAYAYEATGELSSLIDRNGNPTTITHDHLGRVASIVDALSRKHARTYTVPAAGSWIGPTLTSASATSAAASVDFSAALNPGDYQIGNAQYPKYGYPPGESFYRDATFDLPYVEAWDLGGRLSAYDIRAGQTSAAASPADGFGDLFSYDTYTTQPTEFTDRNRNSSFAYNNDYEVSGSTGYGVGGCAGDPTIGNGYQRDPGNRVIQASASFELGCSAPVAVPNQNYAYYAAGGLHTYSGPDGTKTYTYDARGLVTAIAVTLPDGGTENWSFTYDTAGRSLDLTFPDGHVREQHYDSEGRLTSRCYIYASTSHCYTATYDAAGNPTATSDPYGGSETYAYDALNRLTGVTRSAGGAVEHTESYAFNLLGALHTGFDATMGAGFSYDDQRPRLSGSGTADSAIPNTLGGQTVTRNTLGQVTALNGATVTYNGTAGGLIGVTQPVAGNTITEGFRYDAFLRRGYRIHTETSPATTTQEMYVYDRPGTLHDPSGTTAYPEDPGNIVAILNTSAQLQDAYMFAGADHPLRLRRSGTSTFYEADLTRNVRRLRDSAGNDLGGYRYTAFGQAFPPDAGTPGASIAQALRWKGRPFVNVAGGLYDVRARWWSPQLGAFLTIDGYQYQDTSSTLWGWGGQNPIRWSDPTGHDVADWLISSGFYANSQTAIQVAGGIALGAGTIATGGLALEAVGGSALAGGLGAGAPALAALADNEGPEIASAESDLIKSLNDLYSSQPDASAILTQFFKANLGGGDIALTPGINSDLLEIYLQIALRAKDPIGVQAQRIDLIERTLGCGKL